MASDRLRAARHLHSELAVVQRRKVVQRRRDIGMIGTEGFLTDGKYALRQWYRF